jgi:hypothetical protein
MELKRTTQQDKIDNTLKFLKDNNGKYSITEISKILNISVSWLAHHSKELNIIPYKKPSLSNETISVQIRNSKGKQTKALFIKLNNKWKLYSRYILENYHGKLPNKIKIIYNDGNYLNCDISNLSYELIKDTSKSMWNNATDKQVANLLILKNNNLTIEDIPQDLIELKKLQLKFKYQLSCTQKI